LVSRAILLKEIKNILYSFIKEFEVPIVVIFSNIIFVFIMIIVLFEADMPQNEISKVAYLYTFVAILLPAFAHTLIRLEHINNYFKKKRVWR
jgi:hypothetical protein